MRLANIARGPNVPVTVAEWDATPGLHEWIEGEIRQREEAARDATAGPWFAEHPEASWGEEKDAEIIGQGKLLAVLAYERNGHLNADHIALNGPDYVLRRCAADRKILAAHPYTTDVLNPSYGPHTAGFGCETCHDWDGITEGRGNCDTILALAEAYGLEPAGKTDVEVIRA
ncbi:DUF6221 family protein [Streptomyces sp. NRRL F-4707]|uniref:DUF6221 family protein n=1 Tax=Streptomyces sp. NRRL F-4707 TaxID=1519496 RepID=UPI001F15DF26|nr:DUF6221 family protein [Streptomyces sp. NRRL F-4707]